MAEAATRGVLWKKVFLEVSQNSQEKTCAKVSLLLKKRLWHRCFPVNFVKFLRTPFLQNSSGRLLLPFATVALNYSNIYLYNIYLDLNLTYENILLKNIVVFTLEAAIRKIGVFKNFAIFTRKYLCWSLFIIKLQLFL